MNSVTGHQLDLFAGPPPEAERQPPALWPHDFAALDDAALVAAIPDATLGECPALAGEAGRRRLAAAVPALETLCRRFTGFGIDRAVPEQLAALDALAVIGGPDAAQVVARLIDRAVVQGPGLAAAVAAATRVGAILPDETARSLLQHADPAVRADACRCVRTSPEAAAILAERLDDLDAAVVRAAACALGRMGRPEARPILKRLLRDSPSEDVIDAVPSVADEDCLVLLGRVARSVPGLAGAALDALDSADHPRAAAIAAAARRRLPSPPGPSP